MAFSSRRPTGSPSATTTSRQHNTNGISIGTNATGVVITENLLADNESNGLVVLGGLGGHGDAEYHTHEWHPGHRAVNTGARHHCGQSYRRQSPRHGMFINVNSTATNTNNTARQNSGEWYWHRPRVHCRADGQHQHQQKWHRMGAPSPAWGRLPRSRATPAANNGANGVLIGSLPPPPLRTHIVLIGNTIEDNFFHGIASFCPGHHAADSQDNTLSRNHINGIRLSTGFNGQHQRRPHHPEWLRRDSPCQLVPPPPLASTARRNS